MAEELCNKTIHELNGLLEHKEICSVEIMESVFRRIESVETKVHAYITRTYDLAKQQAQDADKKIKNGEIVPLTGIPIAVKDIMCTSGIKTTCGSRMLENFVPPYDATAVVRLKEQGAVFVGKTNMDEFAMGSSNETSYFGPTYNPWDLTRIPGGSSGGSAACVAASECIASLGTDTGGSIRQPASHCGVVGLKPTYGRVSRFGLIAFASSLDQIGPVTKDVHDAAIVLNCISGFDPNDSTSVNKPVPDYTKSLTADAKGLTIGIPKEYFTEGLDREVESSVRSAIKELENLGANLREISLPHTDYAVAVYYLIAPAEASSNLARYDGVKYGYRSTAGTDLKHLYELSRSEGFGPEVKRRIMLGTYALSSGYYDAYYKKASQVRTLIQKDFREAFKHCDLIVSPTVPAVSYRVGEKIDDPLSMYLDDVYTVPANLAGLPGISIPCGFSKEGLPVGLQITGNLFEEEKVLRCAYSFEQNTGWHTSQPQL
jgi:aspartyl-tRNA(Asn)/glutamyl-tRNA(Gln) amidotransferase subunit A